jgi:hypothetical protein
MVRFKCYPSPFVVEAENEQEALAKADGELVFTPTSVMYCEEIKEV